MKPQRFKTMLTLLTCLLLSVTASGQCSIHGENCIHYSEKQDINCLRCLKNEPYNDSIMVVQDSIIQRQTKFIQSSNDRLIEMDNKLVDSKTETAKEKRKKKRNALIAGGTGLAALIEGIVIWFGFK